MFSFPDFERYIAPVVLEMGEECFYNGGVRGIKESEPGTWIAEVRGAFVNRVRVGIRRDRVTEWRCTCSFDDGPVCKHVVAVLLALEERRKE